MNEALETKLGQLPLAPGVYLYKDAKGEVIYVGKAKRLRLRVRSYFQEKADHPPKTQVMVSKIADLDVIATDTEAEALILENTLIKKHRPRYNVMYRDDKSLPYICVTPGERPRVFPTRTILKDGSRYFGPYDQVWRMKDMLDVIRKTFHLCSCACTSRTIDRNRGLPKWRSCFEEYVGACSIHLSDEEYRDTLRRVVRLLNGKHLELVSELKEEMEMSVSQLRFEHAALMRDGIAALRQFSEKMKVVSGDLLDRDIFVMEALVEENLACGVLLRVREGKLVGRYHKYVTDIEGQEPADLLQGFVEDYYTSDLGAWVPDEVHLGMEIADDGPIHLYLSQSHGRQVPIVVPKIGEKAQMLRMASANARLLLGEYVTARLKAEADRVPHALKTLQEALKLPAPPRRIECFDNSNIQGSDAVASMVCFVDAKPRPGEYKRFTIRTVVGADDFASMKEIVTRRYARLKAESGHLPDLIVVDGGKGQLSSAMEALRELDLLGQVPIVGLAKRLEEIWLPNRSEPVHLPKTSSALKLLQRLRDEAHRFAITFHRETRSKRTIRTELRDIPGVGPATAAKLLKTFGSVKAVKSADETALAACVGPRAASAVLTYFSERPDA
jgi:excinuclease ABC subunit C